MCYHLRQSEATVSLRFPQFPNTMIPVPSANGSALIGLHWQRSPSTPEVGPYPFFQQIPL